MSSYLGALPFFSSLDRRAVEELAEYSDVAHFKKGRVVLFRGEIPTNVFVVVSGSVQVERKKPRSVTVLPEGSVFNEGCVYEAAAAADTVRAAENGTVVVEIPASCLRAVLCAAGKGSTLLN